MRLEEASISQSCSLNFIIYSPLSTLSHRKGNFGNCKLESTPYLIESDYYIYTSAVTIKGKMSLPLFPKVVFLIVLMTYLKATEEHKATHPLEVLQHQHQSSLKGRIRERKFQ